MFRKKSTCYTKTKSYFLSEVNFLTSKIVCKETFNQKIEPQVIIVNLLIFKLDTSHWMQECYILYLLGIVATIISFKSLLEMSCFATGVLRKDPAKKSGSK